MLIGYARVSTNEQHLDLQRDALLQAGVAARNIYTDKVTGVKSERPGLKQALSHLRDGDTFLVWRLDRLGRSLRHLIDTVTTLKNRGVAFKSLTENIDTATATGNLVFQIFGALAEFERNLITERTVAGLVAARARGRTGGRPRRNPSSGRVNFAKRLYHDQKLTIAEIIKTLNVSKSTLYRWLDLPAKRQELDRGKRAKP
jgi:DNA invertase Pin-like site-specific DNA recombinase